MADARYSADGDGESWWVVDGKTGEAMWTDDVLTRLNDGERMRAALEEIVANADATGVYPGNSDESNAEAEAWLEAGHIARAALEPEVTT